MLNKLLIIGIGNQVFEIIQFCKKYNIELNIIAGSRQKNSNYLEKNVFKKIKIIKFKQIEYLSQLKYSKVYKNFINGEFDYILSIGSPFIFNKKTISLYKNRLINSHSSPLPQYKGGGGLTWRYLNQDTRGTILYHYVNEKIDDGLIIYKHTFKFPKNKKIIDWINIQLKEEIKGIKNMLKILHSKNSIKPRKQSNNLSTYFPRINTEINGFINFSWHGSYISRFINAFSFPYNGATSFVNNNKIRLFDSIFVSKKNFNNHPFLDGIVFDMSNDYIYVLVSGGYLKLNFFNIISKYKIKLGDRIFTPIKFIDKSYKTRVSYNAKGLK